jgi:hypothetical protein
MAFVQSCAEGDWIGPPARLKSSGWQSDHQNVQKTHKSDDSLPLFGFHPELAAFVLAAAARLMK